MAYKLVKEQRFEPEASQFRGDAERVTAEIVGPPEQISPVGLTSQLISWWVTSVQNEGGTPLQIKIWADTAPTWETKYKVELTVHASPLPWTLIIGAVAALMIVAGLALVTWQVTKTAWGWTIPLAAIVLGGLALYALSRKRRR